MRDKRLLETIKLQQFYEINSIFFRHGHILTIWC